jgi:hypothetical protein
MTCDYWINPPDFLLIILIVTFKSTQKESNKAQ